MMIANRKQRTEERGIALLLTLGVLSLLMIMTITFAFTSRIDLLASEVNADMVKARLLCESGLERVTAMLRYSFDGSATGHVYPATYGTLFTSTNATNPDPGSDPAWRGRSYMFSSRVPPPTAYVDTALIEDALATDLGGGLDFIPQRTNAQITAGDEIGSDPAGNQLSWHHFTGNDENNDGVDDIIGRTAFIVVDESGKLDPESMVTFEEPYSDDNGNGTRDAGEYYADLDNNGAYTSTVIDEASTSRVGWSPQEVNLDNAIPTTVTITGNGNGFRTGMNANAQTWFSWRHMQAGVPGMSASEAVDCLHVMFPQSHDIEAWDDGTNDKHRFDLYGAYGANWTPPAMTPATLQAAASNFSAANTGGIPWIAQMEDSSPTPNSVSNQVAANLIDYCDSDDNPTNDYSSLPSITHCGLEEVVFINEVLLRVKMEDNPPPADKQITVTPYVELINIWGADLTVRRIELEIDLEFSDNTIPTTETPTLSWGTNLTPAQGTVAANSYGDISLLGSESHSWTTNADQVQNFKVTAVRIAVGGQPGPITTSRIWDIASIGESTTIGSLVSVDAPTPGTEQETTAEVQDPRANLKPQEWAWRPYAALNTYTPLGTVNSNSDPSATGYDAETTTDPVSGLSTAFIRNAPMQNLWELGCIHRGEAWRTINLKAYNDGSAAENYSNGDGRILDQVKIGSQTEVYGRVSANSPVEDVWTAVVAGVRVGTDYDTPTTGGTQVTATDAASVAALVLDENGGDPAAGGSAWPGRGGIGEVTGLTDGTCGIAQDTDKLQEEIIGKIAHLVTARQNYFNVIVVAQALKDIGSSATSNESISVTRTDGTTTNVNILAEQKIKAVVYRDAFRNEFEVKRYEFLED